MAVIVSSDVIHIRRGTSSFTRTTTTHVIVRIVRLTNNGVGHVFHLLPFIIVFRLLLRRMVVQPTEGILNHFRQPARVVFGDFIFQGILYRAAKAVEIGLKMIARLYALLSALVRFGILLRLTHHAFNFFLAQPALVGGDGDLLGFTRSTICGSHLQNSIGIHIEGHFNLRYTARCRRQIVQLKLTQNPIILSHGPFSFIYLNQNARLVISIGGEYLGLASGNRRATRDELCHHTACCLDAQRERRYV
mmetsp:Transcript_1249/g.2036  ORF Transcript_1249/g.2036 Transcript_1249/m.2036 type:complete len:248 (-) Transcript_1249:1456-2199(-)